MMEQRGENGVSEGRALPGHSDPKTRLRVEELGDRIRSLDAQPEEDFGTFTRWDWAWCLAIGVGLPLLAVWVWAP